MATLYTQESEPLSTTSYFDSAVNYAEIVLVFMAIFFLAGLAKSEVYSRSIKKFIIFALISGLSFVPSIGFNLATRAPNPMFWFPYIILLNRIQVDPTNTTIGNALNGFSFFVNFVYLYMLSAAITNSFNGLKRLWTKTPKKPDIL